MPTHSERVYRGQGDARDLRVFDTDLGRVGALICSEHHVTLVRAKARPAATYNLATGGSCIVNPSGLYTREPVFGHETIVWSEIDQTERRLAKAYFDVVGHSARWDLLQFVIRDEGWEPSRPPDPSPARLRESAERHEVRLDRLAALRPATLDGRTDRASMEPRRRRRGNPVSRPRGPMRVERFNGVLPAFVWAAIDPAMRFSLDTPVEGQRPSVAGSERIGLQRRAEARQWSLRGRDRKHRGLRRERHSLARAGGAAIGV